MNSQITDTAAMLNGKQIVEVRRMWPEEATQCYFKGKDLPPTDLPFVMVLNTTHKAICFPYDKENKGPGELMAAPANAGRNAGQSFTTEEWEARLKPRCVVDFGSQGVSPDGILGARIVDLGGFNQIGSQALGWGDSWADPITLPPLFLLDSGWWVFAAETADNKAPASLGMLVASPDPQDPNIERYITMSIHFVRTDAQE